MSLKDCNFPLSVKTTHANPIDVFFEPALSASLRYDVAVGFFSTAWVRDAATGVARFASQGGKARWVISPVLSKEDFEAITTGVDEAKYAQVEKMIKASFESLFKALTKDVRKTISWLIFDGLLEIKIGIPKNQLSGMLHAKTGVFEDIEGNRVGFSGSYNLTGHASSNWEVIDIFCDWKSQESSERIDEIEDDFLTLWSGDDPNLAIYHPTRISIEPFLQDAKSSVRPYQVKAGEQSVLPQIPEKFLEEGELRDYQLEAIKKWFGANGQGILAMATGSGKTVIALSAATQLAHHAVSNESKLLIVAVAPYQHLAEQWATEAREFGYSPYLCYGGTGRWAKTVQRVLTEFRSGARNLVMLIAVNDTFSGSQFQTIISDAQEWMLLIADEMHVLGARSYLKALPSDVRFRLGLSATPVRHGDEEGTEGLERYFGKPVYEFSLGEAIKRGFLCEYYYYPVLCELNDDEMGEYRELSLKIAKLSAQKDAADGMSSYLQAVLIERARLLGGIRSKINNLSVLMAERSASAYNLVYCSDTSTDDLRQVDEVVGVLGRDMGMRVHKFTAEEKPQERKRLIEKFCDQDIQVLVAIRCLDEGVDIPRTETAFILASSSNPRQYVQRRGRVLRRALGKKYAHIYDFIAVPDLRQLQALDPSVLKIERNLVSKELKRVNEFVDLSLNSGVALEVLRKIKIKLNLLEV